MSCQFGEDKNEYKMQNKLHSDLLSKVKLSSLRANHNEVIITIYCPDSTGCNPIQDKKKGISGVRSR
ncbi:hypothetical protein [Paenibacillus sp. PDC88]|uniref:hypothetical protein n=1 Tax=Paenibacillus sp. PDC88 TaxID=1884375 RepID=UPI00115FE9D2